MLTVCKRVDGTEVLNPFVLMIYIKKSVIMLKSLKYSVAYPIELCKILSISNHHGSRVKAFDIICLKFLKLTARGKRHRLNQ